MTKMYAPFEIMNGEVVDLHICSSIKSTEGVAMAYFKGKECVLRPCTLLLTQYRLMLWVDGDPQCTVNISLWGIERWKIQTGNYHVIKALEILQQQHTRLPSLSPPGSSTSSAPLLLTVNLKHVWIHHVVIPRNSMIIRNIQARLTVCANTARLHQLPAFALEEARAQKRESGPAMALGRDEDYSANEDFGWCLWNPELEWERLLYGRPIEKRALPSEDVRDEEGAGLIGKDLRPWFHHIPLRAATNLDQSQGGDTETLYTSSPTYPTSVVEPIAVDKTLLLGAMGARSRARFPALSYVHLASGAVLARSAQPLSRSRQRYLDATLCQSLINRDFGDCTLASSRAATSTTRAPSNVSVSLPVGSAFAPPPSLFGEHRTANTHAENFANCCSTVSLPSGGVLKVADCRPSLSAKGNAQMGGGYESGAQYSFCSTEFYNIENIYSVSKSFAKLRTLIASYQGDNPEEGFYKMLHDTQWLHHIQRILVCSSEVSRSIVRRQSCLIHCTDGWDRTAQCCAAAMILLDPFYRTAVGLCILIEKEFCSFGHKFAERSAHQVPGRTSFLTHSGVSAPEAETQESNEKLQVSPVFVQFMDVVFQLLQQFPEAFEFTPHLLAHLSEEVYSCFYGTFLCNCAQERVLEGVRLRTRSIWTDVMHRVQAEKRAQLPLCFVNAEYDYETAWACISRQSTQSTVLIPNCSSKCILFWHEFYFKADVDHCVKRERNFRKKRETTRALSWGHNFDAFLDQYIRTAREKRAEEVPTLRRTEFILQATGIVRQPLARSVWCAFDSDVCFGCFKNIGVFTGAARCDVCKHNFCMDCVAHLCVG